MTDRWLMGFSLETDWVNTSINKCFDPPKEYEIFAEIAREAASQAALPVPVSESTFCCLSRFPVCRFMRLKPTFSRSDEAG